MKPTFSFEQICRLMIDCKVDRERKVVFHMIQDEESRYTNEQIQLFKDLCKIIWKI